MEIINTFVFLVSKRREFILPALDSLKQHTPPNYQIIAVNMTQPDADFERGLWERSDCVVRTRRNLGFAQGMNLGARLAVTEYVTLANDDVIFWNDEWWQGIIETFEKFPRAVAVNPFSPKEPGWGYGEPGFRVHATLEECQKEPEKTVQRLKEQFGGSVVDGVAMWLTVVKRDKWEEIGMFDERFFPGGSEDYDFLSRSYKDNYRVLGTSLSFVWHHWGQSTHHFSGQGVALPDARAHWNKTSTDQFGDEGLYRPKLDVWYRGCERTDETIWRALL